MDILKALGIRKSSKEEISQEEQQRITAKNWMPIQNVVNGIVVLKNGTYVKILEVIPINFKLKSRTDKRFLILNYRSFLKACKFPMQISVQCKKADVEPHIKRIKTFLKTEKNENVKKMIKGYIKLVSSLSHGSKGAISRRFFLIIPYVPLPGVKNFEFRDVEKQLSDKHITIKEFLSKCGNEIIEQQDTEWVANVLYTYLNKKTCEVQKFGGKLVQLSGLFLNSELEDMDEDEGGEDE